MSAFVAFTFVAYAIHQRLADSQGMTSAGTPAPALPAPAAAKDAVAPTTAPVQTTTLPTVVPPTEAPAATAAPAPTAPAQTLGQYRDGDYTGTEVDAYYGLVQVQATIKQGQLVAVQFLEYPNDRRTSIRINNRAIPYLQQEAIQAQSANVDIISGATLTSEAFVRSLQVALDSAKAGA